MLNNLHKNNCWSIDIKITVSSEWFIEEMSLTLRKKYLNKTETCSIAKVQNIPFEEDVRFYK